MSWFYSPDGKERVEVHDALFESLISDGTIKPEALLWREGMADWRSAVEVKPELFAARGERITTPVAGTDETGHPGDAVLVPAGAAVSPPPPPPERAQPPAGEFFLPPVMLPTDSGATLSLILGITGVVAGGSGFCCCFGSLIAPCLGIAAVVFGHGSLARINAHPNQIRGREQAIAGLITGYAAIALSVGGLLIALFSVGFGSLMSGAWPGFGIR